MSEVWSMLVVQEAIHSVALEHAEDCACVVCKAADGDVGALVDVASALSDSKEPRV